MAISDLHFENAAGNRTQTVRNNQVNAYTYKPGSNRLLRVDRGGYSTNFSYDARGAIVGISGQQKSGEIWGHP